MAVHRININCHHAKYLFKDPLCKKQYPLQKICNIVFHILTLGIPLGVYHAISCCYKREANRNKIVFPCEIAVKSVQDNLAAKPYSKLGLEALQFAQKKLGEHPETAPFKFTAGWHAAEQTHQPVHQEIALLTSLYWDVSFKNFKDAVKKNKENPWSSQEVIQAADECMKISYAISNLSLDDLDVFTASLAAKGENRTYAQALTRQDSYLYRTFYYATDIYHWARGGIGWGDYEDGEGLKYPEGTIPAEQINPFYQKGTVQNSWNQLYNEYCARVRATVNIDELKKADTRHYRWTKPDTGIKTFLRTPDTTPT